MTNEQSWRGDSQHDKHSETERVELLSVLETNLMAVSIYRAIRDSKNKIIDFEWIYANSKMEKLAGTKKLKACRYNDIFPASVASGIFKLMIDVVEKNKTVDQQISYKNFENQVNWYHLRAEKYNDGLISFTEMISAQKNAEVKAKDDAHFLGQILEMSPDIIYILDLDTKQTLYTNRSMVESLGYSRQQISEMANPLFAVMHPEDIPRMEEHLAFIKTIKNDEKIVEIEYRLRSAKGGYKWILDRNSVFRRNEKKIPIEKIGISQDISVSKTQEVNNRTVAQILQQSEQVVEIGSWEYDVESGVFKWSDGMYKLFNLSKDEPISPEIYLDYCAEDDRPLVTEFVRKINRDFQPFEETFTMVAAGNKSKIIKIKSEVQRDKQQNPVKVVGIDLDITEEVRSHREINSLYSSLLKKNEELRSMNNEIKTFNLVTAHDYKETLQQLYTNLEYIITKDARNLSDSGRANIRRAQSSIQKMNLLTDDINTYFKLYDIDEPMQLVDVNSVLDKVIEKYTPKLEQCEAKVEKSEMPRIPTNPALFAQLIGNLLDNAIKFRKAVVPLVIKIRYSKADEMNAVDNAIPNSPYYIVSVSDNGIGLHEKEAEKIFDLFYKVSQNTRGSGIGLAVCRKIMNMHEGFIIAEGTPAHGSTFSCYFPTEIRNI